MRIFLFIFGVLAFLAGALILASAKSAVHEIEAFVLFLVSAVLVSGASIVEAVNRIHRKVEKLAQALEETLRSILKE